MTEHSKTLTLDADLEAKLAALAARTGQSVDALALDILRSHADAQERLASEIVEDEERWQRYVSTGQSVPYQSVRTKLQNLAASAAQKASRQ